MKTAMQELFDWIEETGQPINKELLLKIKELSFKEKEQIIRAYEPKHRSGFRSNGEFFSEWLSGEDYYNETYQNK